MNWVTDSHCDKLENDKEVASFRQHEWKPKHRKGIFNAAYSSETRTTLRQRKWKEQMIPCPLCLYKTHILPSWETICWGHHYISWTTMGPFPLLWMPILPTHIRVSSSRARALMQGRVDLESSIIVSRINKWVKIKEEKVWMGDAGKAEAC